MCQKIIPKEGNSGLCLKEDINGCAISKEESGKQIILQRNETNESSIKLKMKNNLSNKLKVLSSERQDACTKLKESNKLLENIEEKKEKKLDLDLDKKTGNAEEHNNRVLNISS